MRGEKCVNELASGNQMKEEKQQNSHKYVDIYMK